MRVKPYIVRKPGTTAWDISYTLKHPLIPPLIRNFKSMQYYLPSSFAKDIVYFAQYTVFEHPLHPYQYRIDLKTKAQISGKVDWFGIHITEDTYKELIELLNQHNIINRTVTWRDIFMATGYHIRINRPANVVLNEYFKDLLNSTRRC